MTVRDLAPLRGQAAAAMPVVTLKGPRQSHALGPTAWSVLGVYGRVRMWPILSSRSIRRNRFERYADPLSVMSWPIFTPWRE